MKKVTMPIILMAISTGFGSKTIKPGISSGNLLGPGKYTMKIVSAEFEQRPSSEYNKDPEERQLKIVLRCTDGVHVVWLNDRGYLRMKEVTVADIPSDIDFKALGTTKTEFGRMSDTNKISTVFTKSTEGHAIRKDTKMRILSAEHTLEAQDITRNFYGHAGLAEDEEFDEDSIGTVLKGRYIGVTIFSKEYQGDMKTKTKSFFTPSQDVIQMLENL